MVASINQALQHHQYVPIHHQPKATAQVAQQLVHLVLTARVPQANLIGVVQAQLDLVAAEATLQAAQVAHQDLTHLRAQAQWVGHIPRPVAIHPDPLTRLQGAALLVHALILLALLLAGLVHVLTPRATNG